MRPSSSASPPSASAFCSLLSRAVALLTVLRSLVANRRLLLDFVLRDLRARYVGSSMGFFWSVIFPIVNLLVYHFVFRLVLNTRWNDSQGALEVALVMLAGIVIWQAFAEAITRSTGCLVDNANLIQKVVFPSELLPAFLAKSSLVNMLIGLPVLLAAVAWFGHLSAPSVHLFVRPVPVAGEDGVTSLQHPSALSLGERSEALRLPIVLERGFDSAVEVELAYEGTATLGDDFLAPTTVTIPARAEGVDLLIQPLPDTDPEEDLETIRVSLVAASPGGVLASREDPSMRAAVEVELADEPPLPAGQAAPGGGGYEPRLRAADYRPLRLSASLLAVPLLLALQFLFTLGLGYLLSVLNAFVRDTFHLVGVGVTVWMFCTPIFYPPVLVEAKGFGWLLALNPMHWLIDCWRAVLLYGAWPDPGMLLRFAAAALLALFLGGRFFLSQKTRIPDLL